MRKKIDWYWKVRQSHFLFCVKMKQININKSGVDINKFVDFSINWNSPYCTVRIQIKANVWSIKAALYRLKAWKVIVLQMPLSISSSISSDYTNHMPLCIVRCCVHNFKHGIAQPEDHKLKEKKSRLLICWSTIPNCAWWGKKLTWGKDIVEQWKMHS